MGHDHNLNDDKEARSHYELGVKYRGVGDRSRAAREFGNSLRISKRREELYFKNKVLNEIEMSQGRSVLESKPRRLGVTVTSRCNIRCFFCGGWKNTWDLPERAVREIIDYYPYLKFMYWLGGEVFFYPHFMKLFDEATKYPNLMQYIATNGLAHNEEWSEKMVRSRLCLSYSIDGITKDKYEKCRTGGKFEDLIRNMKQLNDMQKKIENRDFTTGMSFILMKSNYGQLPDVVDFAKEYDLKFLSIMQIQYVKGEESIFLNRDEKPLRFIENSMPDLIRKAKAYNINIFNWLPDIEGFNFYPDEQPTSKPVEVDDINRAERESGADTAGDRDYPCHLPWQRIFVESGGRVKVESYCRREIGDISKNSLSSIWNGEMMQTYRKKIASKTNRGFCDDRCIDGIIPKEELMGFVGYDDK